MVDRMAVTDNRYWAQWWLGEKDDPRMEWRLVDDAEAITLPGWEHLDLCLHAAIAVRPGPQSQLWTISEGRSGAQVATGGTVADVRMAALGRLKHMGRRVVTMAIKRQCRRHGVSPRYRLAPVKVPTAEEGEAND